MNSSGHMPGKKTDMHDVTEALQAQCLQGLCPLSGRSLTRGMRKMAQSRKTGIRHSLRYSWRKRFRYWAGVHPVTLRKHWMK